MPEYPAQAREDREEGLVVIECLIDENGQVLGPEVVQSASPALDQAALDAVAQWVFRPAVRDGVPIYRVVHIPVRFELIPQAPERELVAQR